MLPRALRTRVAGSFLGELFLSDAQVVERVRELEEKAEHESQANLVNNLLDAAGAGGPAALGWEETVQALSDGRVHQLVLVEGRTRKGRVCSNGHAVIEALRTCPFCAEPLAVVTDLAEWAVEKAFDTDARIATVRAGAAKVLTARGGVGALLRY